MKELYPRLDRPPFCSGREIDLYCIVTWIYNAC